MDWSLLRSRMSRRSEGDPALSRPSAITLLQRTVGRKRRRLGWGMFVCAGVMALVMAASAFRNFGYAGSHGSINFGRGTLFLRWVEFPQQSGGWYLQDGLLAHGVDWLLTERRASTLSIYSGVDLGGVAVFSLRPADKGWGVLMSLWVLIVLPLIAGVMLGVWARRSVRRAMADRCRTCGYDLRGLLATGPCPECGAIREQCGPGKTTTA